MQRRERVAMDVTMSDN